MSEYTSNLLCHFVGRSKKTDEERFELLCQIIKEGQLKANVQNPKMLAILYPSRLDQCHAGEVFERCDCVCFCDIPDDALGIHTSKYGYFGLGFNKSFAASQGAHPVMYVPKNYQIYLRGDEAIMYNPQLLPRDAQGYFLALSDLSQQLVELERLLLPLLDKEQAETEISSKGQKWRVSKTVWDMFMSDKEDVLGTDVLCGIVHLLAFVKLYDATLPDNHPDNYYMEREWRCMNNVKFSIDDISKVYLPNETYRTRFSTAFPAYQGEFKVFSER